MTNTSRSSIYKRTAIDYFDGIPIFNSSRDDYTENYERIAADQLADSADLTTNIYIDDETWRLLEDSTASLIERYAPRNGNLLDIGVGSGRLLSRFKGDQYKCYGVDISLGMLPVARDRGIDVCSARAEELPYLDGIFDLVVATDVLEHVLDLYSTVSEMYRVCKIGGLLVVRVPYREDLTLYLLDGYPYKFAHVRNFDECSLQLQLCQPMFPGTLITRGLVQDRTLVDNNLRLPIPRGKSFLTRQFRRLKPTLRNLLSRILYRPRVLEINMVIEKNHKC